MPDAGLQIPINVANQVDLMRPKAMARQRELAAIVGRGACDSRGIIVGLGFTGADCFAIYVALVM